jgi:hypothetical protein
MTPEQLRAASNVAHWSEGTLLLVAGLFAVAQEVGWVKSRYQWWACLVLAAGILLPVFIGLSAGPANVGDQVRLALHDRQQLQHLALAILMVAGAMAELRPAHVQIRIVRLVWPTALTVIGLILMIHTEYGTPAAVTEAVRLHRYQGAGFVVAGALRYWQVFANSQRPTSRYAWILAVLVSAGLLIAYREPPGAYEGYIP